MEYRASLILPRGAQTLEQIVGGVVETVLADTQSLTGEVSLVHPNLHYSMLTVLGASPAATGEPFPGDVAVPLLVLVLFNLVMMNSCHLCLSPAVCEAK